MGVDLHPTAVVSSKAKISEAVSIGPYSVITDNVSIECGSRVGAHCLIDGNTSIGKSCEIFSGAVIGSKPQDLKYKDEKSFLKIGDNNIIREYCTFNPGTEEGGETVIGNDNLFMAYSHIAHDCLIGNNCIIANAGTLAGHVVVEDKAVIGGLVAVHQFVRIGRLSIIGGCSKVVQDIPPYSTCDGHPARVYGLNLMGLRRNNIAKETIGQLSFAFKLLFNKRLSLKHALENIEEEIKSPPEEVACLLNFFRNSQRGVARSCRKQC